MGLARQDYTLFRRSSTFLLIAVCAVLFERVFAEGLDKTWENMNQGVMLEDLGKNIKEEYMSETGLAMLYDRSGGKLTDKMADVIAKGKITDPHHIELLAEIRAMWDEWDLRDEQKDDMLEFDAFYNGYMAPYFGCYRCDETKKALKTLDMDSDGVVDWNEFELYLKWALSQYPDIKDSEELLSVAFREGLVPAMQDEVIKQTNKQAC